MTSKYQKLLERRKIPGALTLNAKEASFAALLESEDVKYLMNSMESMDADYTKVTLGEAERVYKYLLPFSSIELQGSVITNTHIMYHSDIDVLVITPEFETYEGGVPSGVTVYAPSPIVTLTALRKRSRETIASEFKEVTIKDKPKAIELSGGSLKRKIDIVTSNWFNTSQYQVSKLKQDRAIQVLCTEANDRITNKPFMHQHLLNLKASETNDGSGRLIRLLKTLKIDAGYAINVSSYDICSLVYNMTNSTLPGGESNSFKLSGFGEQWLWYWIQNPAELNKLKTPNGMREIISSDGTDLPSVRSLWYELHKLNDAIKKEGKLVDRVYARSNNRLVTL